MRKSLIKLVSVPLMVLLCSSASFVFAGSNDIKVERTTSGISAPLIDRGDYYFHPDGRKITFYRKKDVYVVKKRRITRAKTSLSTMQRFKTQYGERVQKVSRHQLGRGVDVVRIDNRAESKLANKQAFDIKPEMLLSLDSSTQSMMPVFTTQQGQADLLLLPKVTLEINDLLSETDVLAKLKTKYGLRLVRKLKLSANVYSMEFINSSIDPSLQFSHVRQLMSESFVAWAEPQFYVRPKKEQFTPDDTLIGDQWNLIDRGFRGSRCDTDCDANNAWGLENIGNPNAVTGGGDNRAVIAVIDDGVQLDHPDLSANIWVNSGEIAGNNIDDDGNGYIDDINGYDFVTDESATLCDNGQSLSDGDVGPVGDFGQDANPSPRATANCVVANETLSEDNHGTAVAGIAAAEGNNDLGIAGVAYSAEIMAIRAISDFDETPLVDDDESFCNTAAEAMEYAAQHADVINNSWSIPIICTVLEQALIRVTSGTVAENTDIANGPLSLGSKRDGTNGNGLGSTVVFSSGNDASGWVKVTVPVSAGEHAYEWRLLRSATPDDFDDEELGGGIDNDTVWLDDIVWPDGSIEGFEPDTGGIDAFTTQWILNSCNAECTENFGVEPVWDIETRGEFVRSGNQSARIQAFIGDDGSDCGNSYLHQIREDQAGEISFWVWVSTDTQDESDKFEFLIDGREVISYGDLAAFGFVDNPVAYPALTGNQSSSPTGVIAVGASKSGDLSEGTSTIVSLEAEERASYSQYGPTLDLVAPSSDQHLGITTTDRTGPDGFVSNDYTSGFGGTSAAAPVVSGVAAAMLAIDPSLDAADIKTMLRASADEIGPVPYVGGRNDFHGFGRVNMFRALLLAQGNPLSIQAPSCQDVDLDYDVENDLLLSRYQPDSNQFCPAIGPIPDNDLCLPIRTRNGSIAVICL